VTFTAKLRRSAAIWRLWREHRRVGGVIAGATFRWVSGDDYVTGELAADQVVALRGHPEVVLEASGAVITAPAAVEAFPSSMSSVEMSGAQAEQESLERPRDVLRAVLADMPHPLTLDEVYVAYASLRPTEVVDYGDKLRNRIQQALYRDRDMFPRDADGRYFLAAG
jgi:hypothetical protein